MVGSDRRDRDTPGRLRAPAARMVYLFLAAGFVAWVPGSCLLFSTFPLYRTFELAPSAFGIDAITDQQAAGLVMKFGGMPVVWGTIATIWYRWAATDRTTHQPQQGAPRDESASAETQRMPEPADTAQVTP